MPPPSPTKQYPKYSKQNVHALRAVVRALEELVVLEGAVCGVVRYVNDGETHQGRAFFLPVGDDILTLRQNHAHKALEYYSPMLADVERTRELVLNDNNEKPIR